MWPSGGADGCSLFARWRSACGACIEKSPYVVRFSSQFSTLMDCHILTEKELIQGLPWSLLQVPLGETCYLPDAGLLCFRRYRLTA